MQSKLVRTSFFALSLVGLVACTPEPIECGRDLEYDTSLRRCACPDRGIYVCDSPDDCRCEPRDAGTADAGMADAGIPDDGGAPPDARAGCAEGETVCGGRCIDTTSDRSHCGSCSGICGFDTTCVAGECIDAFVDVTAGPKHVCGVRYSGAAYCWGTGDRGQLGNGTMMSSLSPVPVSMAWLAEVASGAAFTVDPSASTFTCGRTASSTVLCWGPNGRGQLGDGTTNDSGVPVEIPGLVGVRSIATGSEHACAVVADGSVRCWGDDRAGQLGRGTNTTEIVFTPVPVPGLADVSRIGSRWASTCALTADQRLFCWGPDSPTTTRPPTEVALAEPTQDVALTLLGTCALGTDGVPRCWGDHSVLGTVREEPVPEPTVVPGFELPVSRVFAGVDTFCAIDAEGVLCWGPRTFTSPSSGGTVPPTRIAGSTGATDVAIGTQFACMIIEGRVWCVGGNSTGGLGDGTTMDSRVLREVPGLFE